MPLMHVIAKGTDTWLTVMGFLPSRDYALKFPTSGEALQHLNAPENARICDGARVEIMDVREDTPMRAAGIETEYDPWNAGRDV